MTYLEAAQNRMTEAKAAMRARDYAATARDLTLAAEMFLKAARVARAGGDLATFRQMKTREAGARESAISACRLRDGRG